MLLVGGLLLLHGPLAGILDTEARGDHHHLAQTAGLRRRDHHLRQTWIKGNTRELTTGFGQLQLGFLLAGTGQLSDRLQLFQESQTILDMTRLRWLDEGEGLHVAKAECQHLQDDGGQVGAQDLGVGKGRTVVEILHRVEANTDTVRHPAATPFTLVGAGLGNRLDGQALHLGAPGVATDASGTRIDDVTNARHRQRGLRHVGGEHDAPPGVLLEHLVLLGVGEAGIERQHLGVAQIEFAQGIGGVADLPLAVHEDKDVPQPLLGQLLHRIEDALQLVALLQRLTLVCALVTALFISKQRAIAHLHRVGAP